MLNDFLKKAQAELPPATLLTSAEDCAPFASDWTRSPGTAGAVALPRTTADVAWILKHAQELDVPIVPSGGRTGLAGGAVAMGGELVLSLSRMNRLDPVDTLSRTVRVQSGAVTQAVHEHCAEVGLSWPIDLASKGSCTIGGNLSTNAGGVRVVRYGMTRKWICGLQIVTMGGEVIELNSGLEKNNTGYDLLQLVIGSEGTLAVVTEATLKLVRLPDPRHKVVFFFAVPSLEAIPRLLALTRGGPFEIRAFEFFSDACLRAVGEKLSRQSRLSASGAFSVLIEVEGTEDLEGWLESVLASSCVVDGLVAETAEDQKAVWGLREGITESLSMIAPLKKYDLSLGVRNIVPFLSEAEGLVKSRSYGFDLYFFGHFGDGSPHVNLLKQPRVDVARFEKEAKAFESELFALVKHYAGSISAEHGVGMLKKAWLPFSRTPRELALFRAIKSAFDPKGLLNPGKVL